MSHRSGAAWPRLSLHPTLLLLLLLGTVAGQGVELAVIFASVLIHELGHLAVAELWGLRATRVTLYPFGGVAELPQMTTASTAARVTLLAAGPLANLVLVVGATLWAPGEAGNAAPGWLRTLTLANGGLLAANLLPVGPLDGGRLLEVVLERRLGIGAARRLLLRLGVAGGVGMAATSAVAAAVGRPWGSLLLFGLFLAVASHRERARVFLSVVAWCLQGPRVPAPGPPRLLAAPATARVRDAASFLGPGPYRLLAVVGKDGRIQGWLSEGQIGTAITRGAGEATLEALFGASSEEAGARQGKDGGKSGLAGREAPEEPGRTQEPL